MENQEIELFDAYINNRLSQTEKAAFEQNRNADIEFQQRFEEYKLLVSGIELSAASLLKEKLTSHESSFTKQVSKRPLYYKIAAGLVFLVAASFLVNQFISQKSYEELYSDYYSPYPNIIDPLNRSEENVNQSPFQLYEAQQYQEVIEIFGQVSRTDAQRFYLSQSYMALGQFNRALNEANSISEDSRFYAPSRWYIALIQLNKQDTAALRKQLEIIISSNGDYTERARDLKENL
ncbi:MAG: hypothetical protein AAGF85_10155 [Bacteroidota bacterium]